MAKLISVPKTSTGYGKLVPYFDASDSCILYSH